MGIGQIYLLHWKVSNVKKLEHADGFFQKTYEVDKMEYICSSSAHSCFPRLQELTQYTSYLLNLLFSHFMQLLYLFVYYIRKLFDIHICVTHELLSVLYLLCIKTSVLVCNLTGAAIAISITWAMVYEYEKTLCIVFQHNSPIEIIRSQIQVCRLPVFFNVRLVPSHLPIESC